MEQILELERRITAALDRLAFGIERQAALPAPQPDPAQIAQAAEALASESVAEAVAEAVALALAAERAASARVIEDLKRQHEQDLSDLGASWGAPAAEPAAELVAEVDRLSQLLDQQGLELHRMRHLVVQLREHLRLAREAAMAGAADADLINRALVAEVEALGAIRSAELAELDEILAELAPFVTSAEGGSQAAEKGGI